MGERGYEGVLEDREVKLIRQWANRAGIQPADIPDVVQEVAMVVIQRPEQWVQPPPARRRQLLWGITKNTLGKVKRSEGRRRRRDEQKSLMVEEAYCDNTTPMRLDVQEVVASLDDRCRTVCGHLSRGLSKSQIAEQMHCGWHVVDRLVRTIRQRLEEAGVNEWLQ